MGEILNSAIVKIQNAKYAFCRFITANDTGKNGSHQAGFYIPKSQQHFCSTLRE